MTSIDLSSLAPEDDPRRLAVRSWLEKHPNPTLREVAEVGYAAPHFPPPYGLDADGVHQLIIDDELRRAKVGRQAKTSTVGFGIAAATILYAGTEAQREKHILPILAGEQVWCQLFSEPGAGSDLSSLATRAVEDGDGWLINGQKVWTSFGHEAEYGILLARTDPDAPKQQGISYFICPMDLPGIEIRPLIDMTGVHHFNEVFLDNVRLPAEALLGEVNQGWHLAKVSLGNERISLSRDGMAWGRGPTPMDLIDLIREHGGVEDAAMRQRIADLYIRSFANRLLQQKVFTAKLHGQPAGAAASVSKALGDDIGQIGMNLAKDLAGAHGMLTDVGPLGTAARQWHFMYLFSRALTVGGGTSEVQRNIIGERELGLPKDDVEAVKTAT